MSSLKRQQHRDRYNDNEAAVRRRAAPRHVVYREDWEEDEILQVEDTKDDIDAMLNDVEEEVLAEEVLPDEDTLIEMASMGKKRSMEDFSDSELSVLNDGTPPRHCHAKPTKRVKSTNAKLEKPEKPEKRSTKASVKPPAKSFKKPPLNPSDPEEQIKTLKSQIYKCGLRKNWYWTHSSVPNTRQKELSNKSPQEQLVQLQGMLRQLGMTGRFSVEKAQKIKERRELNDELDFIQEGAKNLGEGARRRRR